MPWRVVSGQEKHQDPGTRTAFIHRESAGRVAVCIFRPCLAVLGLVRPHTKAGSENGATLLASFPCPDRATSESCCPHNFTISGIWNRRTSTMLGSRGKLRLSRGQTAQGMWLPPTEGLCLSLVSPHIRLIPASGGNYALGPASCPSPQIPTGSMGQAVTAEISNLGEPKYSAGW